MTRNRREGSVTLQTFDRAYANETVRLIRERMRYGAAVFLAAYGAAWIFEFGTNPERMGLYARLYFLEALVCAVSIFALERIRGRRAAVAVALGVFAVLSMLTTAYHVVAPGEIEVLTMALTFCVVGSMVLFPWGTIAQASATLIGLALCFFAVWQGVPARTLPGLGPAALFFASCLTIFGARFLDRYRSDLLSREIQLEQVSRARSEADEARRAEATVQAALARVGEELISYLDRPLLLNRLCEVTTEVLGCDLSHTLLWVPERQVYRLVAEFGATADEHELLHVLEIPRAVADRLLQSFIDDDVAALDAAHGIGSDGAAAAAGIAQVCIALRRGADVVGIQVAAWRKQVSPLSLERRRIAEGIAQLASLALENSRLVAEATDANRAKSDFVAAMSHELRTPLGVIIGYTDILLEELVARIDGEETLMLQRVRRSAGELLDLIVSTLDLSKIERGGMEVVLSEVDLCALLAEVDEETRSYQDNLAVSLSWHTEPDLPRLRTDRGKLKVVVKNLVINALKFTESGRIAVTAYRIGDAVRCDVSDTGIGIPEPELSAIFEPFRQAQGGTEYRRSGVGLGLYIARRLMEMLGGTIEVESTPGVGSAFSLRIPATHPGPMLESEFTIERSVKPATVLRPD